MSISPARRIAFDALLRVEAKGAFASDVLHAELGAGVSAGDAALATELTMGVLRWRGLLDFLLERISRKPVTRLDLPVAVSLRMGLYQLRHLQKIPARAAVHESVELVKQARKTSAASFVNAVLRKSAEQSGRSADDFLPASLGTAERLSIRHSHPRWLVERWLARMGETKTTALLEADNRPPRLSCAVNDPATRAAVFDELSSAGLRVETGLLLANAFSVAGGSASHTNAFREGRISIQDEASQAVPLLLGVKRGESVLDLCAAPGGKTAALARAAVGNALICAADLYPQRLSAAKAQFARLRLNHIHLVALNAEQPLPFALLFDRVLVDAPCSGTGTLARHPEIRWRLQPARLDEFHRLQINILRNAIAQTAPGGKVLYSTCSMEPEENDAVIEEFLREPSESRAKVRRTTAGEAVAALSSYLAPGLNPARLFDETGAFRTRPDRDGTDGFFAALLEKGK